MVAFSDSVYCDEGKSKLTSLLFFKDTNWNVNLNVLESITPLWLEKIRKELKLEPGSIYATAMDEMQDPKLNPEILQEARVSIGNEISPEEKNFTTLRRRYIKKSFAKYMNLDPEKINEEDIPIISFAVAEVDIEQCLVQQATWPLVVDAGYLTVHRI